MEKQMNWLLISGIFSGLTNLETYHGWNLSIGENSKLAEVFYKYLAKGWPKSKEDVNKMFEEAYVATWGPDHTCDETRDNEMREILLWVSDAFDFNHDVLREELHKLGFK